MLSETFFCFPFGFRVSRITTVEWTLVKTRFIWFYNFTIEFNTILSSGWDFSGNLIFLHHMLHNFYYYYKIYKTYLTPYQKLKSIKNAKQYLKPNITFKTLNKVALECTGHWYTLQYEVLKTCCKMNLLMIG